jgi:hypothetical protein
MRYELLIQPKEPGAAYDPAAVDRLLHERGATALPDGSRNWRLKSGDVTVRTLVEGGKPVATELKVPLSDRLDLIRELVVEGVGVAQAAGARLVDPQLAKSLTLNDDGIVADQYFRTAQYAGQYAGVSEAIIASYGEAEQGGLKAGTKVLLAIIAFLVGLYFIADKLIH